MLVKRVVVKAWNGFCSKLVTEFPYISLNKASSLFVKGKEHSIFYLFYECLVPWRYCVGDWSSDLPWKSSLEHSLIVQTSVWAQNFTLHCNSHRYFTVIALHVQNPCGTNPDAKPSLLYRKHLLGTSYTLSLVHPIHCHFNLNYAQPTQKVVEKC